MNKILAVLILFIVFFNIDSGSSAAQTKYINFGGSSPGGAWYAMVGGISPILTREIKGLNVLAEATGGDLENGRRIANKELDMVFLHARTLLDLYFAAGEFKNKPGGKDLSVVCKVYETGISAAVLKKSEIKGFSDLVGKKIAAGPPGSGSVKSAQMILDALGLTGKVEIKFLGYDDAETAMKEGHIDMMLFNMAPSPNIFAVELTHPIRLIGFNKKEQELLKKKNPALIIKDIPGGTYKTVKEPVPTIWSGVFWVSHKDLDEKWIYEIIKVISENKKKGVLEKINISFKNISPGIEDARELGVLIHPGALKHYRDHGNW